MRLLESVTDLDRETMEMMGYEIVEVVELDNYNIILVKMSDIEASMMDCEYQLAFAKEGSSYSDPSQQLSKLPMKKGERPPIGQLTNGFNQIKNWINEYGCIAVASFNNNKTKIYAKMFKRAGIPFETDDLLGMTVLFLGR